MIELDATATISPLADIEMSPRGTLVRIGAHTTIDSFVKIKPVGGRGNITIGDNCFINSGTVLYSGNGIQIGHNCLVAANCTFAPVNHAYKRRDILIREQRFLPSKGGIILEGDNWIGANCVLLDGAYIEMGAVVAAGSTVRGRLARDGVYAGNPATMIGRRE